MIIACFAIALAAICLAIGMGLGWSIAVAHRPAVGVAHRAESR